MYSQIIGKVDDLTDINRLIERSLADSKSLKCKDRAIIADEKDREETQKIETEVISRINTPVVKL